MEIFGWNFTRLLNNKIYTLPPSFIEIYLKSTNVYSHGGRSHKSWGHDPPLLEAKEDSGIYYGNNSYLTYCSFNKTYWSL